jgi:hypothetical protein
VKMGSAITAAQLALTVRFALTTLPLFSQEDLSCFAKTHNKSSADMHFTSSLFVLATAALIVAALAGGFVAADGVCSTAQVGSSNVLGLTFADRKSCDAFSSTFVGSGLQTPIVSNCATASAVCVPVLPSLPLFVSLANQNVSFASMRMYRRGTIVYTSAQACAAVSQAALGLCVIQTCNGEIAHFEASNSGDCNICAAPGNNALFPVGLAANSGTPFPVVSITVSSC